MRLEPVWKMRLEEIRKNDPGLFYKLVRYIMAYMHRKNLISIEDLERESSVEVGDGDDKAATDPNRPSPRTGRRELEVFNRRVLESAETHLSEGEVNTIIHLAYKNEMIIDIGRMADDPGVSFADIVQAMTHFCNVFTETEVLDVSYAIGSRVSLIRRFLSDQLEYINIAKHHLTIRKITDVVKRIIVPGEGSGRIGGKASGLMLAKSILEDAYERGDIRSMPCIPPAYFLRSDAILHFIKYNNLDECYNIKYRDPEEIQEEHPILLKIFKNATFPPLLLEGLRRILEDFQDKPLVIRSSSLLEDRFGTAFSGKYRSLFVANQGPLEQRLDELTNAIAEVYASVFSPDALIYRRERGLLDFQEEMAIIVQEVVGDPIGPYYFPAYAGVAFSNNEIRWSPRIHREDGVVRMVAGLGTRAVDRMSDDYAHLMSPGQPQLRANVRADEIIYYSQRLIDVIDRDKQQFNTLDLREIFRDYLGEYPELENLVSVNRGSEIAMPVGILLSEDPEALCVTFEGLTRRTPFARTMKDMLSILADAYHRPVDVEFAADSRGLCLLQCRPQSQAVASARVSIPKDVPIQDIVFSANRHVQDGCIEGLRYIVYIDPFDYDAVQDYDDLVQIGQAVGHLNRTLPRRSFILMGPGRWGSRGDIKLGVKVTYFDINNCRMLIEIARQKGSYVPEVSFGTHFFQDLVEADIRYLPLYPDDPVNHFNEDFLHKSPTVLAEVAPMYKRLERIVRVIDVPAVAGGRHLAVVMDGEADSALAYLRAAPDA
ncbi:MAG: PEP/pyruvate-binding domain-containing protein [Acidobacteria bacterium]|nr:PEP/pyruvate-binding domain-containing protein [Acidobacteriota bacterium]